MAYAIDYRADNIKFNLSEVTGALGDSVTVIPLVVALAVLTEISLPHVLLAFGLFQIVWGLAYGLPVSVEPMKALAALAIAGTLTYADLVLAGLVLGVVLLAVGLTGTLARVEQWIGEPVIRGVQFAVALMLLETAVRLALADVLLAGVGLLVAGLVASIGYRDASALVVVAAGVMLALVTAGVPAPQWPGIPPIPPLGEANMWHAADGVFAQLAMTIGNAALATSLVFADRFDADVSPDALSTSMGAMNLTAVPLGGIPMCHGCDGVVGKHEFGARTGGTNVILGLLYLGGAFFATATLLAAFPLAMLGILLALVAGSLGTAVLRSPRLTLSAGIGLLALLTNLGIAFLAGIIAHLALERRTDPQ